MALGARPAAPAARLRLLDAARGFAIVQMLAYHFCYDLNHFSYIHVAMLQDAGWIAWRTAIVSQFLFLAGFSLALRAPGPHANPLRTRQFWRRWLQIAACAAGVTLASSWLFGARFIWFGVLHFVALAQVLLAPLLALGGANIALGIVVLALGLQLQLAAFAGDGLSWIGFSPVKPQTEDFVPLFPWLGVMLLGIGLAALWQGRRKASAVAGQRGAAMLRPFVALGRWPLTIYMLHQPLFFGTLSVLEAARHGLH